MRGYLWGGNEILYPVSSLQALMETLTHSAHPARSLLDDRFHKHQFNLQQEIQSFVLHQSRKYLKFMVIQALLQYCTVPGKHESSTSAANNHHQKTLNFETAPYA